MTNANDKQAPASAVPMPEPCGWCDPNAKYSKSQMQAYGDARAEEARREGAEAERARLVQTITNANNTASELLRQRDEARAQIAATQRTAGGDAVIAQNIAAISGVVGVALSENQAAAIVQYIRQSDALAQRTPAASADNFERAAAITATWPSWKRDYELTKHSAAAQGADVVAMRKALRPFAKIAKHFADNPATDSIMHEGRGTITVAHLRAADKALAAQPVEEAAAQADGEMAKLKAQAAADSAFIDKAHHAFTHGLPRPERAAPTAQPTPDAPSRFGSPELQAMIVAHAAAQPTPADIEAIADELESEAMNYEGDFADTVKGCAEALRQIVTAQPTPPDDERAALIARLEEAANDPMASGNCYVPAEMLAAAARSLRNTTT